MADQATNDTLQVSFQINDLVDESFGKAVLKGPVFMAVYGNHTPVSKSLRTTPKIKAELEKHPMLSDPVAIMPMFNGLDSPFFALSTVEESKAREIVTSYCLYDREKITFTAMEHYLWTCEIYERRRLGRIAGFPVAGELKLLLENQEIDGVLTIPDFIKAMMEAVNLPNSLEETKISKVFFDARNKKTGVDWTEYIIWNGNWN